MLTTYIQSYHTLGRSAKLYLISNTIQALSAGAIGVLYTLYLASLGYGENFIGLVLFAGVVGAGLAIVPASPLVARLGWRNMLLWSDWVGGLALFLQLAVPVAPVILGTSVAAGASFAIVLIVNTPLLTAYSPTEGRTAVFGLGSALGLIAAVLGSLLGGVLPIWFRLPAVTQSGPLRLLDPLLVSGQTARSYELALLVTGALAIPSIVPIYRMRDDRRDRVAQPLAEGRHAGGSVGVGAEPALALAWLARARGWLAAGRALAGGVIGRFSVTQALLGFGAGLFVPYLSLYFVRQLHTTTAFFGALFALLTILQALTALLAAALARRFGEVRGSVLAQAASLPFLLGLGLAPGLALIALSYLIRGSLINMAGPPLQAFLMEAVPERRRVVASEAFNVSWQIAAALGVAVGGQIIHAAGFNAVFLLATACYGLSTVLLMLWFGRRERHGKLETPRAAHAERH
ncbi:MAG: MFS transporter [Ktedonobacterales bacterium]|nr:MFS transporter [Ktedonobacterales bacterium]